jgi:phosphoribosyl-ATP pyrophosphohydrolase
MAKRKSGAKESPFGEASRAELLDQHYRAFGKITPATAWRFVYEELLWFDKSTGLVHLYESDKVRPGRSSWYNRSIAFTDRLAQLYEVDRAGLKGRIDRLFLACLERMLESRKPALEQEQALVAVLKSDKQLGLASKVVEDAKEAIAEAEAKDDFVPYAELAAEVMEMLVNRAGMGETAAAALARDIVDRAQYHLTFGSNRQNVLGEGFEDLLKMLAVRVAGVPQDRIALRRKANELPGFQGRLEGRRRIESPDMAIIGGRRTAHISTVKWSLRHDRQKQLTDELDCYVQLCSQDKFPEYALVTNEYDPGRLKNSSNLSSRGKTVDRIYHINPDLLVEVLSDVPSSVAEVQALIEADRLRSLEAFLNDLTNRFAPKRDR